MICASVGVAIWELCRKNGDPRPFRCRAVGEEASLVSIKQQRRQIDPVPMKITDPHHSTRAFLMEKGAARPVTRTGVGRKGGREGSCTRLDSSWWVEFQRQGALRRAEVGGRRGMLSMDGWMAGWLATMSRLVWVRQGESSWQRPMRGRAGEIVIDPQR